MVLFSPEKASRGVVGSVRRGKINLNANYYYFAQVSGTSQFFYLLEEVGIQK